MKLRNVEKHLSAQFLEDCMEYLEIFCWSVLWKEIIGGCLPMKTGGP